MDTGEWIAEIECDDLRTIEDSIQNGEIELNENAAYHTTDQPFCNDPDCSCHSDESLFDEYINRPVLEGRLTIWDAQALLWPEQIGEMK